jgi:uncharacterized delta-60 repeat protein
MMRLLALWLCWTSTAFAQSGSLDTSFGTGGVTTVAIGSGPTSAGYALAHQSDGKIIVAASGNLGGKAAFHVARFNADGSLDTDFGTGGVTAVVFTPASSGAESPTELVVDALDRVVVAGYAPMAGGKNAALGFAVARLLPDGAPDTTFDGDGKVLVGFDRKNAWAYAVALDGDGRIVLAGSQDRTSLAFARVEEDGTLDTTFDGDGRLTISFGRQSGNVLADAVAVQADGRIVSAGTRNSDFVVVRLLDNGARDTSFDGDGLVFTDFAGAADEAHAVVIDGDCAVSPCSTRRIIAGGRASAPASSPVEAASTTDFAIARYTDSGALDSTFGAGGRVKLDASGAFNKVRGLALQGDGRLVFTGPVTNPGYSWFAWGVGRVDSSGALDATFGSGGLVDVLRPDGTEPWDVALDANGDLHVVGVSKVGGASTMTLAKFLR